MKVRTLLLLLVMSAAAGCEGKGPTVAPTPAPPAPFVTVRVEGRVLAGEGGLPVAGAVISLDQVWSSKPGSWSSVRATTDDQGHFSLTTDPPSGWRELQLAVNRLGFEPNLVFVRPGDGMADLRLVPLLVIRPGESIEVSAFVNSPTPCFIESAVCRRVIVEAPPGETVDVDVVPMVEGEKVRLAGPLASQPFSIDQIGSRVTTSSGEVYIVPLSLAETGVRSFWQQRVTLRAQRRGTGGKP